MTNGASAVKNLAKAASVKAPGVFIAWFHQVNMADSLSGGVGACYAKVTVESDNVPAARK